MADINSQDRTISPSRERASTDAAFSGNEPGLPEAPGMTLTARLREGWRLSALEKAEGVPFDRKSRFWQMATLWLLFVVSLYAVWSVLE